MLLTGLLLLAAIAGAQHLRVEAGMEWSAASIRDTVAGFGFWAPAAYVGLVSVRQLLVLPSVLVLTSAGLLFGAAGGALIGGIGLAANAGLLFLSARLMGREQVLPRLQRRWPDVEERARRAGPLFLGLMTAHPAGLLTPFHFAAGVTGIGWLAFFAAIVPAATFRAACYSFFGANLLAPGSQEFWIATGVLGLAALLPLAHPGVRRRILRRHS